jgi:hypothetical protein
MPTNAVAERNGLIAREHPHQTGHVVNEFVNGHSPPEKRVQLKRKVAFLDDSLPPPDLPANGVEYGVGEFLSIIQTYKRRSKQRGAMIIKMQSPEYNYLKRSRRSVYRVIAEHDKGRIFEFAGEWRHMGRPKIMKNDEVDLFTESVHKNPAPLMGCPPPLARGGGWAPRSRPP